MSTEVSAGFFGKRGSRGAGGAAALLRRAKVAAQVSWQEYALLLVAALMILPMRVRLLSFVSLDYTGFLSKWFAFLQAHGFAGLGQDFANYNVPYLYLLWVGTLVTPDGLLWVKVLSSASDVALAAGAFVLLRRLGVRRFGAAGAAVLVMMLPEVLLNSAVWGQADSLYSALLVWALASAVKRRSTATWVFFALAFAFKLQAVFLLPVFALAFVVHRHRWRSLLIALGAFSATYLPALLAGRSISSLLSIYTNQVDQYHYLTLNAPSMYQWIPNTAFEWVAKSGTYFAVGVTAVLVAVLLRHFRTHELTGRALLLVAALSGSLVPFILPMMHERYFFTANVLLFLLAVVERRFLLVALAAQIVAVLAYVFPLFQGDPAFPIGWLTLLELGVILALMWPLLVKPHPMVLQPAQGTDDRSAAPEAAAIRPSGSSARRRTDS